MKKTPLLSAFLICLGLNAALAQYTAILNFNTTNGRQPFGNVIISNNVLYGMTNGGGAHSEGCIFSVHTDGSGYKDLLDFAGTTNGQKPYGSLVRSGKTLFGMTNQGGANNVGIIFSIDTNGSNFRDLIDFNQTVAPIGANPQGTLTLVGATLYGMTANGNYYGNIFSVDTNGTGFTDLKDLNSVIGDGPEGTLIISGGLMFGMTFSGGANNGVVFSVHKDGTGFKDLLLFTGTNGLHPEGSLCLSGKKLFGMTESGGVGSIGNIFTIDTTGANYKDLLDFNSTNGAGPYGSLIITGKTLWGMTSSGGAHNYGCAFSIDTNGSGYKDRIDFDVTNGETPAGDLILSGSTMYGMTEAGGSGGGGIVFGYDTNNIHTRVNSISSASGTISVYPNPNNGKFTIQLSVVGGHPDSYRELVEIYNILGENVYNATVIQGGNNINIGGQPSGIYLYRVITKNGEFIGEGKFVIE